MPEFVHQGKIYYNPVQFAMDRIGGTWKMPILWRLKDKVYRFGELKKSIKHISDKMLSAQLKELEKDGFIHRKAFPVVPPRVEYTITARGKLIIPVLESIRSFGVDLMELEGINIENYKLH